jgi:GNAT superfamily N-acetyltransferase
VVAVNLNEPLVRPARKGDCATIAYQAYLAGRGHLAVSASDLMIPGEPGATSERLGVLERLLLTDVVSWFHFSHCLVIEVAGEVAGSMCMFHRSWLNASIEQALMELGWSAADLRVMKRRMAPYRGVQFAKSADAVQFETVCVSPGQRRRGLAETLVKASAERARTMGYREALLTVYIGNTEAESLYQKLRLEVAGEKRHQQFADLTGCPGVRLMRLDLTAG